MAFSLSATFDVAWHKTGLLLHGWDPVDMSSGEERLFEAKIPALAATEVREDLVLASCARFDAAFRSP